ncbi:conserved hypothetical protein [Gloeothece citriformis PCC 7424]|uniref:Chlororespiratory reduction protein 7 n=1 Tax=Gloeothece citriformis (strain PCC 7424) TaxID=65393 RepID=B7KBB4_GLOC7|nr:chlororespiratory reduction protein 7 [Gloeothece citriformis]ACK71470.1 conserved hypothetical protein [Gloeothece citriformis PCC 7424]
MPDSIMYQEDCFVVLESDKSEEFLTHQELFQKLKELLQTRQIELPRALQKFTSIDEQAKHLMENYSEVDVGPNHYLQWYVVRLEKL